VIKKDTASMMVDTLWDPPCSLTIAQAFVGQLLVQLVFICRSTKFCPCLTSSCQHVQRCPWIMLSFQFPMHYACVIVGW